MMPQPIEAPQSAAPTKIASTTPNATTASPSIMQVMERFDQSGIKWKKWLQRFENAVEVSGVSKTVTPKVLLHCIGAKAYDELTDLVAPTKPESMQYNELVEILTKHFEPEPLEMMELWAFRNRTQQDEETVKDYVQALLHMANNCGFGDHIQKAVRNQFVFGLRNEKARRRFLQEKQLTLEKAKEIAMGMEAVEEEEKMTKVLEKNEKFEKKINFPLSRDYYSSYKNSVDAFIDDLLKTTSEYYGKNNDRESSWSHVVEGNCLTLTIIPKKDDGKNKPGSSLRAITYK